VSAGILNGFGPRSTEPDAAGVTAAVINFNGREVLPATLAALQRVQGLPLEIMVVDDGSTDGSVDWLRETFPAVRLIALADNRKKPSRARNVALREARTRYVLLLDNDVMVEPTCVAALMREMEEQPGLLCCTPRLLSSTDPGTIYYDGSDLHFLCVSTNSARGQSVGDRAGRVAAATIPGGNGLVDRTLALELGLFDETYDFGWGEDAELFIRGRIAGHDSLHVPDAVATHVERQRGVERGEAQLRNRYRMLLTVYQGRTLMLLLPPLLVFELLLAGLSIAKGLGPAHMRSIMRTLGGRSELRRRRAGIQSMRRRPDGALLQAGDLRPTGALDTSRVVGLGTRLLEAALSPYWRLVVRPIIGGHRNNRTPGGAAAPRGG
jgi:GT2 family glycosyltransferase